MPTLEISLLYDDYANELAGFGGLVELAFKKRMKDAAATGLRHPRLAEEMMLAAIEETRALVRVKTFHERYIALRERETAHTRTLRAIALQERRIHSARLKKLDKFVHALNTSRNVQEVRQAFYKGYNLIGKSYTHLPRPRHPNYAPPSKPAQPK